MGRLNKLAEIELTAARLAFAVKQLRALGMTIEKVTDVYVTFVFKDSLVTHYAYSGWHTGKTIKDGRGIEKLLKQLKNG